MTKVTNYPDVEVVVLGTTPMDLSWVMDNCFQIGHNGGIQAYLSIDSVPFLIEVVYTLVVELARWLGVGGGLDERSRGDIEVDA